jgi:26S proteasome regulatory subunit N12
MLEMDSLPPMMVATPNATAEREMGKQALEYAVLLSINVGDKDAFQRHMTALRPYYFAGSAGQGPARSDVMYSVLGLNLLYLLVENRLADFHCEVRQNAEGDR